jgi:hypothetical protein
MNKRKSALLDECCGFYDGVRGVLFLDAADKSHHFATDIHEGTHRWLGENTVMGSVFRFFALARERAQAQLTQPILAELDSLLRKLTQTSFLPHEVAATYLAVLACRRFQPENLASVLAGLPESYEQMLKLGTLAFGPIDAKLSEEEMNLLPAVVRHVAMAAMSPPSDVVPVAVSLRDLSPFITLADTHSANERFVRILRECEPLGVPGLVSDAVRFGIENPDSVLQSEYDAHAGIEYSPFLRFILDQVEHCCPGLVVAKQRRPIEAWAHQFFSVLRRSLQDEGSTALDEVQMEDPTPETDWVGSYMSQEMSLTLPWSREPVPVFDTTVTHVEHFAAKPELLDEIAGMIPASEFVLHAYIASLSPDSQLAQDMGLRVSGCLLLGDLHGGPDSLPPFMTAIGLDRLRAFIPRIPHGQLVLRSSVGSYEELRGTLAEYTGACHMYVSVPDSKTESLMAFLVSQPPSYVFLIGMKRIAEVPDFLVQFVPTQNEVFIAPTTQVRMQWIAGRLQKHPHHVLLNDRNDIVKRGIDLDELTSVIVVLTAGLFPRTEQSG